MYRACQGSTGGVSGTVPGALVATRAVNSEVSSGNRASPASVGGTAQAGAICQVVHDKAPRYAADGTDSKVLGTMRAGEKVAAAGPFRLWRVSRSDTGKPLGHMRQTDLNCGG